MSEEPAPTKRRGPPPPPREPPPTSMTPIPRGSRGSISVPKVPPPFASPRGSEGRRDSAGGGDEYDTRSNSRNVPSRPPPSMASTSSSERGGDGVSAAHRWRMKRQGSSMNDSGTVGPRPSSVDADDSPDDKGGRYGGGSRNRDGRDAAHFKGRTGGGGGEDDDYERESRRPSHRGVPCVDDDDEARDRPRRRATSASRRKADRDDDEEYSGSLSARRRGSERGERGRGEERDEGDYRSSGRYRGQQGRVESRRYEEAADDEYREDGGRKTGRTAASRFDDDEEEKEGYSTTTRNSGAVRVVKPSSSSSSRSPVAAEQPKASTQEDADVGGMRKKDASTRNIKKQASSGEELFGGPAAVEPDQALEAAASTRQSRLRHNSLEDDNKAVVEAAAAVKPKTKTKKSKEPIAMTDTISSSMTETTTDVKAESEDKPTRKKKSKAKDKAEAKGTLEHSALNLAATTTLNRKPLGVAPRVYDTSEIPIMLKELLQLICLPFERSLGVVLRCFIERSRSITNPLSPVYTLYADNENQSGRMLMCARKVVKAQTPYYIFSTNPEDLTKRRSERSNQYLGKLRGNSAGTEYVLYDDGQSPENLFGGGDDEALDDSDSGKVDRSRLRRELAVIYYNYGLTSEQGRKVEVTIPKVTVTGDDVGSLAMEAWQPSNQRQSITEAFKRIRFQGGQNVLESDRIMVMHQRESRYDPLSSCLVDFKGRATAASVKNFQLIKSFPEDREERGVYYGPTGEGKTETYDPDATVPVLLQMGRVGRDCFNMDLQHPLSVFQAFAICISRFDTKSQWS